MKINSVTTNYGQQKQVSHKGYLKLVNPIGISSKFDPRAISRLNTQHIDYCYQNENCDYIRHCVEGVKAIFENSQNFLVNATEKQVEKAIKKAVLLPPDEGITVGKPLLPLCYMLEIIGLNKLYKKISDDNIFEYMKKCPNTLACEEVDKPYMLEQYLVDHVWDYDDYRNNLLQELKSEGTPSGRCETRIIDQIINWSKAEEAEKE